MKQLVGLTQYLQDHDSLSVFDDLSESGDQWHMHVHGDAVLPARVTENLQYEVRVDVDGRGEQMLEKLQVKFLYPAELAEAVAKCLKKTDAYWPHCPDRGTQPPEEQNAVPPDE